MMNIETLLPPIYKQQLSAYQLNQKSNAQFSGSRLQIEKNGIMEKEHPYLIKRNRTNVNPQKLKV